MDRFEIQEVAVNLMNLPRAALVLDRWELNNASGLGFQRNALSVVYPFGPGRLLTRLLHQKEGGPGP